MGVVARMRASIPGEPDSEARGSGGAQGRPAGVLDGVECLGNARGLGGGGEFIRFDKIN